jgi:hypothetical protein
MNAELLVKLIEEMIDLKMQKYAEANIKSTPQLTELLQEKRKTDLRRLEQIRVELVRTFKG